MATRDITGARGLSRSDWRHRVFHGRHEREHVGRLARNAFGHLLQAASRPIGDARRVGRSRVARATRSRGVCGDREQRTLRLALGTVGPATRHSEHGGDHNPCRRRRLDLATSGHALSRSRRGVGHLPCVGARRRDGQEGLRRKHGSLPTMDRFDPHRVAFRRLADGPAAAPSGMAKNQEAVAPKDVAVVGRLLGQTSLASGLCRAVGRRSVYWQRPGGRGVQTCNWTEVKANGGALARSSCKPDGKPLLSALQRSLGPLLGDPLTQSPKSVTAPRRGICLQFAGGYGKMKVSRPARGL